MPTLGRDGAVIGQQTPPAHDLGVYAPDSHTDRAKQFAQRFNLLLGHRRNQHTAGRFRRAQDFAGYRHAILGKRGKLVHLQLNHVGHLNGVGDGAETRHISCRNGMNHTDVNDVGYRMVIK